MRTRPRLHSILLHLCSILSALMLPLALFAAAPATMTVTGISQGQSVSGRLRVEVVPGSAVERVIFTVSSNGHTMTWTEWNGPYVLYELEGGWDTIQFPNGAYTLTIAACDSNDACLQRSYSFTISNGGNSGAHPMGCKSNEVWLDAQDWWATTPDRKGAGGRTGDDFGHVHTGLCFPQKATLKGVVTLRLRSVLHNNPGTYRQIQVQTYQGNSANIAVLNKHFDRTLAACAATGGTVADSGMTCVWWDTLEIDTRKARYDGEVQIRVRLFVAEPDGKEMRTSTSLHAILANGGGRTVYNSLYQELRELEGRGWYTDINYANATLRNGIDVLTPRRGIWNIDVSLTKGALGIPATSWYVGIDTDFHKGNPGTPLCGSGTPRFFNGLTARCGSGSFKGILKLDTTRLSNGWHRLFLKVDQFDPITGSTNSGVMATYFLVDNGTASQASGSELASASGNPFICGLTLASYELEPWQVMS